ncbi:unnamed protein product [Caenorhabditis brenneri]
MPLDQLLIINSKELYIGGLQQTAKQLNKFIRLWQRGSNPRVEYFSILYNIANRGDKEVIMKGIKHEIIPADHERQFKMARNVLPELVRGGIDIVRVDGVKATIRHHPMPSFEIFITADIMAAASTFSLLGLPDNQILRTVRVMDLGHILKFSLISKKCKNLVTTSKIKGNELYVSIRSYITFVVRTGSLQMEITFHMEQNVNPRIITKKRLAVPYSVGVSFYRRSGFEGFQLEGMDFTIKEWLEHLQTIFYYRKIDTIAFFAGSPQFEIDDIKEVFGSKTRVAIEDSGCHLYNQSILQKFFPMEEISMKTGDFQNSKIPPSVLIQNFEKFYIGQSGYRRERLRTTSMSLNDLLLNNSKTIVIDGVRMSLNLLNKFIKLWMRGSNLHMEYLWIYDQNFNVNDEKVIMKGIKHQVIPDDQFKVFKSVGFPIDLVVNGGCDIVRCDGVKATIRLKINEPYPFKMYVWFDHCVVES